MRARVMAVTAMAALAMPALAQQSRITLTDADDGRVVMVGAVADITVRLPQQAGTAYTWQLRRDPRITLLGATTEDQARPGMVGGRLVRVFRLRATGSGRIPLAFALRSASDDYDQPPARRVSYTLDVSRSDLRPGRVTGTQDAPLSESDAGRIVDVPLDRILYIHLPSNASTGYHWLVVSNNNIHSSAPIEERRDRNTGGRVGGGGTAVVELTAWNRGPGEIVLGYFPPGRGERAVRQLQFRFRVY